MRTLNERSRWLWPGIVILLLAALLRLAGFEQSPIGGDQSAILSAAFDLAHLQALPVVGIKSSVGVPQTAVTSYLAAVPLFIVPRVIAIKWFFSLVDLIAIAWLYQAVRRALGPVAAMLAALLYATNPWIVEFVRWVWYQTLVPAFATIAFSSLLLLASPDVRRRNLYSATALLSATLMGAVHLAAMPWAGMLFLGTALLTWHSTRNSRTTLWTGFMLGAGGSILVLLPYLVFLVNTSFADLFPLLQGQARQGWNPMALRLSSELLTGREVFGTPRSPLWSEAVFHLPFVYELVLILLVVAMLWAGWHILVRPEKRSALALVLGWTLLAPLPFLLSSGVHLQHFYLLTIFPAPFVLIGAWVQGCFSSSAKGGARVTGRIVGVAVIALLLLVTAWWASIWGVRIRLEQEGRLGAATKAWLMDRATEQIRRYLAEHPACQVIIISYFDGDGSPFEWIRSAVQSDGVRAVQTGRGLIVPASCACYMLGPAASDADLAPLAGQAMEEPSMAVPAQVPWRFACIPPRLDTAPPLAEWRNGLSLVRADIEELRPGQPLHITYVWRYREVAPRAYHFFTHLLRDGALVTQSDGPGIPSRYWRDGDLLITHFVLEMPGTLDAGEYQMLVGVYGWPDLERVLLMDGSDTFRLGQWEIP
ncbi:MAG: hypothetical protein N2508_01485 [Anaerolineae bacterium]|nr:hypothetical protein [Anaerolineae bacterium]